jgi:transcriptional regulator GlxA family with amidase domain
MEERLNDTSAERIRAVCRYIEAHPDEPLTIAQLAALASMSRFHFARSFRSVTCAKQKALMPRSMTPVTGPRRGFMKTRRAGSE